MFARSSVGLSCAFTSLKFRGEEQVRGTVSSTPAAVKTKAVPFEMFGVVMNSYKGEKYHRPYVGQDFSQTDQITGTLINNTAVGDTDETVITPDFVVAVPSVALRSEAQRRSAQATRRAVGRSVRSNPMRTPMLGM
jgi:hypothetical protein